MSLGKRLRFEIFKRDGFKCVYCGATPLNAALHVDHVDPKAKGGIDEPSNLVTACSDCNLGKSDIPIDEKRLKATRLTEADQDQADQIKAYLKVQREIAEAKAAVCKEVEEYWKYRLGEVPPDIRSRIPGLLAQHGLATIFEAIDITERKGFEYSLQDIKYFHGVLRHKRSGTWGDS